MQFIAASIRLDLDRTIAGTITLPLEASDLAHDAGGSLRVRLLESVSAAMIVGLALSTAVGEVVTVNSTWQGVPISSFVSFVASTGRGAPTRTRSGTATGRLRRGRRAHPRRRARAAAWRWRRRPGRPAAHIAESRNTAS